MTATLTMPHPDDRVIDAADGAIHDAASEVIEAADGREIEAGAMIDDDDHLRGGRPVPAHIAAQTASQAQAVATTTADPESSTSHDAVPQKTPAETAVADTTPETATDPEPEAPNNPYLTPDDPDLAPADTADDSGGSE